MAVPVEILNDLASILRIEVPGSHQIQPGQPVTARIAPPVSELRAADVLSLPVVLTWISKGLVFATGSTGLQQEPLNQNLPSVLGAMPIADVTRALTAVPGVPGVLGQLDALVPVSLQVPVALKVLWRITRSEGDVIVDVAEGQDTFLSSDALGSWDDNANDFGILGSPEITLTFAPPVVELTENPVNVVTYVLRAKAVIHVGGVTSTTVDLPPVLLSIPAIPVPWILALFRHEQYKPMDGSDEGFALIVVPANSILKDVAQLTQTLQQLQGTLSSLQQFTRFASALVGLQSLIDQIPPQPFIVLQSTDQISNLGDIQIKPTSGTDWQGINANDEITSLILFGPEDHFALCYSETGADADEGWFSVKLGSELYVKVPSLGLDSGQIHSQPEGAVTVQSFPSGHIDAPTFNDELSSVKLSNILP
jgi:hypothetical protein